jgi:hypothetical protein
MQMQGNVRTSLYSPSREMLFTLCRVRRTAAFIRAQPQRAMELLHRPARRAALRRRPGDAGDVRRQIYVLGDSGQIARSARSRMNDVQRTAQLPTAAPASAADGGGRGPARGPARRPVFFLDQFTLSVNETFTMGGSVVGLSGDGKGPVALATPTAIEVFDRLTPSGRSGLDTKLPVLLRVSME